MPTGEGNVSRLKGKIWGDSLLNKLPARSRKRRKRCASKVRRRTLRREDSAPD
jgi:hypothetical protein